MQCWTVALPASPHLPSHLLANPGMRVLAPFFLAPLLATTGLAGGHELPFEEMVRDLLESTGNAGANYATFELEEMLDESFVGARVGLFDAYLWGESARDKGWAADYETVTRELIGTQLLWLRWTSPDGKVPEDVAKDAKKLDGWVKSWSPGALKKASATGGDLYALLDAKDEVRAAAARFGEYMGKGEAIGLGRSRAVHEPILFIPERRRFLDFMAFAGWLRPELKGLFWDQSVINWTNFYIDRFKVVCFLFAGGKGDDLLAGRSMNEDARNGLQQQIVQLANIQLIDNYYGSNVPASFAGGLALNMVIDRFGEANTRVDGDLNERRTEAKDIFVPGGNSEGGWLPKFEADSRWRLKDQGADYFLSELEDSQSEGSKKGKARDKVRHFELKDDEKIKQFVVSGPFLGAAALDSAVPPPLFEGDYREFLRAYRTCFVYWIRTHAAGKDSATRFEELLDELGRVTEATEIEEVFADIYGKPLSSSSVLDKSCLEGAFLAWLPRGKL